MRHLRIPVTLRMSTWFLYIFFSLHLSQRLTYISSDERRFIRDDYLSSFEEQIDERFFDDSRERVAIFISFSFDDFPSYTWPCEWTERCQEQRGSNAVRSSLKRKLKVALWQALSCVCHWFYYFFRAGKIRIFPNMNDEDDANWLSALRIFYCLSRNWLVSSIITIHEMWIY